MWTLEAQIFGCAVGRSFHGLPTVCFSHNVCLRKHGLLGGYLAGGAFYAHLEMSAASPRETDAHGAALQPNRL